MSFLPPKSALTGLTLVLTACVVGPVLAATASPQVIRSQTPISESEIVAAHQFGQTLSIAEWLGPMAPVALSPFFGITCLSGLSLFGGGWIAQGNPLIGGHSPLHNPAVFWTFLSLTILTSVPRLTKVSKPFAQAVDQMEAWSGIITMLVLKVMISSSSDVAEVTVPVAQMGLISMSSDAVLMLAAAINIFVINAVKFFFEVLIWLTPIPFLDAVFECCNKAICAALMVLYAWSPAAAATLNCCLFFVAMLIFGWAYRREIFFRTMLFDALRAALNPPKPDGTLVVFPVAAVGPIKARSKCTFRPTADGWTLTYEPWFRRAVSVAVPATSCLEIRSGFLSNQVTMTEPKAELTFSRLFNASLPELAAGLKVSLSHDPAANRAIKSEFA